jgi:hypothetical protein
MKYADLYIPPIETQYKIQIALSIPVYRYRYRYMYIHKPIHAMSQISFPIPATQLSLSTSTVGGVEIGRVTPCVDSSFQTGGIIGAWGWA